jgi:SAM-dependent methyltransferase
VTARPVRQGRGSPRDVAGPEQLVALHVVLGGAAAIRAAAAVGLLDLLATGDRSAAQAAEALGLDERATRRLLDVLVALGLAADPDGIYRSTVGERTLIDDHLRMWDSLPEVLRHGLPPCRVDRPEGAQQVYPGLVGLLGRLKAAAARRAAERLARPHLRILDLGAGAAPWSLAVVDKEPSCRVTAVDLPAVIPATKRAVEAAGRAGRFEYLAADLFRIELPEEAFDLAIFGSVCHLFGPKHNQWLLLHLFQALRPGGTVAIIDSLRDATARREQAIYALGLLLRAPEGDVFPLSSYREWLLHAEFEAVEDMALTERPPLTLVTARRPPARTGGRHLRGESLGERPAGLPDRPSRKGRDAYRFKGQGR